MKKTLWNLNFQPESKKKTFRQTTTFFGCVDENWMNIKSISGSVFMTPCDLIERKKNISLSKSLLFLLLKRRETNRAIETRQHSVFRKCFCNLFIYAQTSRHICFNEHFFVVALHRFKKNELKTTSIYCVWQEHQLWWAVGFGCMGVCVSLSLALCV